MSHQPDGTPGTGWRQASQAKRESLLDAMRLEVGRMGYHGSSLDMLARLASVTKNQLLHYFPNKEALALALLERIARDWNLELGQLAQSHPEPRQGLEFISTGLGEWVCGTRAGTLAFCAALWREVPSLPAGLAQRAAELQRDMLDPMRKLVRRHVRQLSDAATGKAEQLKSGDKEVEKLRAKQIASSALGLACALDQARLADPSLGFTTQLAAQMLLLQLVQGTGLQLAG